MATLKLNPDTVTTEASALRPYAPSDAPALALALGRQIVRQLESLQTVTVTTDDPFAGVVVGKGDKQAKVRALQDAREALGRVHATYSMKMDALAKQIVATQEALREALAQSCNTLNVSLPAIAETLGIAVSGDTTIAEMSADAKARAALDARLAEARAEAKREKAEAAARRDAIAEETRAAKMRLDGFSEIEIEIDRKNRAAKRAAKLAAKLAAKQSK